MSRAFLWKTSVALGLMALALAGAAAGFWMRQHQRPPRVRQLSVLFLNVGAGDCTLIRTPDGRTILLDAGPPEAGPATAALLRRLHLGVDLLILASSDPGSIGGVPAILAAGVPIRAVWDNALPNRNAEDLAALEAIRRHHVPSRIAHAGDRIPDQQFGWLGDNPMRLSILWPPEKGPRARADALVCRLDYGQTAFLLAGAADGPTVDYLTAGAGDKVGCDAGCGDMVLQVASGGAELASPAELLRRATPTIAVVSCGSDSPPSAGTLHRLQAAGAAVWRTDTQGSVLVTADGRTPPTVTATHL